MSERIKQLAIDATLIVAEPNGFDPTRLSMSQQKFAELIVKECCVSMRPMLRGMISRSHAIHLIKEQLGVNK